jgi:hypothetical protein
MQENGLTLSEVARRVGRDKAGLSRRVKAGDVRRNADGTFNEDHVREDLQRIFNPGRDKPLKPKDGDVDDVDVVDDVDDPADTVETEEQAREAVSLVQAVLREEGREVGGQLTFDDAKTANEVLRAPTGLNRWTVSGKMKRLVAALLPSIAEPIKALGRPD